MLTPTEKNIYITLLSVAKMNYVYCGLGSSSVDFIGCDDHVVVIIVLLESMGAAILVSILTSLDVSLMQCSLSFFKH